MKLMNYKKRLVLLFTLAFTISACSDSDDHEVVMPEPPPPEATTIVDVAVADGNFTTLVAALQATGLDETLDDETATFTVFAPTDAAFALLGQDTIDGLLEDTDTLTSILTYHVLASEVDSAAATAAVGTTVETVNGASVGVSADGDALLINTATVTMNDIMTDNGVIHVIDAVLMPPAMTMEEPTMNIVETAVNAGSFNTLVAAVQAAGLDATLSDPDTQFTVFAPTDAAFALINDATLGALLADTDALTAVLLQHVIAGAAVDSIGAFAANGTSVSTAGDVMQSIAIDAKNDSLKFAGVNVVTTDIKTTNGIIHVIDAVVLGAVDLPDATMNVVEVAASADDFSTLVTTVLATGLETTLADADSTFTVFAPTNEAFAALGDETIAALLADTDTLTDILLYHVVSGAGILSDGAFAAAGSKVATANTDEIAVSVNDGTLYVNNAMVADANILASNGVIHAIDRVILPPAMMDEPTMTIAEVVSGNEDFSTLLAAVDAAGLVDTLSDESVMLTVFAPTNAAFDALPEGTLDALLADVDALTEVLQMHLVDGKVSALDAYATNGSFVVTLGDDRLNVMINADGSLQIAGATVTMADIYTTNGVIHVIDTVITE
jgi:transforming growth factor-beta-induced protein